MFPKGFNHKEFFRVCLVIGCLFISVPVYSATKSLYTYYNFNLGSKSLAMGNAFTAVADDLSTVFWNPAGLADFSNPVISLSYKTDTLSNSIDRQDEYSNGDSMSWTENFESKSNRIEFLSIAVPVFFWDMRWNFALSYYQYLPYDFQGSHELELTGNGDVPGSGEFTELFCGSGGIDVLGFSLAVYLSKYFCVGITLQHFFNSGSGSHDFQSSDLAFAKEFSEKLQGLNLIVGCLLKLDENLQIGFTYHSGIDDLFTSEYRYESSTGGEVVQDSCSCTVTLPAQLSAGLSVRPYKKWLLVYDFSKILWSSGRISNYYGNPGDLPFPVRDDYEMNQQNIVNHRLGTEISVVLPKTVFFIRGGVFWERQLFVDANDEAVWMNGFSLGLGVQLYSKISIDLAYMNQNASWKEAGYFSTETLVDTHYRNHIFALSASYVFRSSAN